MSAYFVPHLLQGRRYLITGATGGAGSRAAIEISRVGGVCTLLVRDVARGEKVLQELMGHGHALHVYKDAQDITQNGFAYDGVFHAAGAEMMKPLRDNRSPPVDAALNGAWSILSAAAQKMNSLVKDGGSIVFMSSVAAVRGQSGMSAYCASKAAIEGLARAAAVELAGRRIRVNCIRAGAFDSPMHRRITQRATPEAVDEYARKHLFGFGRSEDVAHAVLYLLSDMARWITGSAFPIHGGYLAK